MIDWPQHMLAKAIDRHNLTILRRTWDMVPDQLSFFERYLAVANHPDSEKANVFDAFSQGQLDSKMWLNGRSSGWGSTSVTFGPCVDG